MSRQSQVIQWRDALAQSELDRTAKLVGFALSVYFNSRLEAFPSRETIGRTASVTVKTVDRAIRRLEAAGLITVLRSLGRVSNRYLGLLPNRDSDDPVRERQQRLSRPPTGTLTTANRDFDDPLKRLKALESGGAYADRPLRGSAAPLEECPRCHEVKGLAGPEFIFCAGCLEERAEA